MGSIQIQKPLLVPLLIPYAKCIAPSSPTPNKTPVMLSSIRVATLYRPQVHLLHRRSLRSTSAPQGHVNHTSDTYSKEVDATLPSIDLTQSRIMSRNRMSRPPGTVVLG